MTLKTIKNVDEETWHKFKQLASRNRMGMGKLLNSMIHTYESESKHFWKYIFEGEKLLTDKEADALLVHTQHLRKEYGFRK